MARSSVPDPRVPAPLAIAVAAGQSALRVALALGHAGELGHLGLHDRLGEHAHALAQEVDVALGDRLAHRLEHGHPVLGHRGSLRVVGCYSNDARMTRWPFQFSATPLLHQVWGLNPHQARFADT